MLECNLRLRWDSFGLRDDLEFSGSWYSVPRYRYDSRALIVPSMLGFFGNLPSAPSAPDFGLDAADWNGRGTLFPFSDQRPFNVRLAVKVCLDSQVLQVELGDLGRAPLPGCWASRRRRSLPSGPV